MTDRELLDRIRSIIAELEPMIAAADQNMKYHTRRQLITVLAVMTDTEKEMAWHVEG